MATLCAILEGCGDWDDPDRTRPCGLPADARCETCGEPVCSEHLDGGDCELCAAEASMPDDAPQTYPEARRVARVW